MKREVQNQLSRRRIIDSALQEFGEKSYSEASLNTICSTNGISKGIVYHYFKDKDELYLACVRLCYEGLTEQLKKTVIITNNNIDGSLRSYFDARLAFFTENPVYLRVFCGSVVDSPDHLKAAIAEIRADFDQLNRSVLLAMLEKARLRSGIRVAEAVESFCLFQDFFHSWLQSEMHRGRSIDVVIREHEAKCHRVLDILLYGVIETKEQENE